MIYGHLRDLDTYDFLLAKPAWKTAFEWLKTLTAATPPGIVELQGDYLYANIHGYETLPREQCRFETPRRDIDLQYCIDGGELIAFHPAFCLRPDGPLDDKKDARLYGPAEASTLRMAPGNFAVFFPADAHAPKQQDGSHHTVFKVVLKIDRALI